jgi:hypothetical protein
MTIVLTESEVLQAAIAYITELGFKYDFTRKASILGVALVTRDGEDKGLSLALPIVVDLLEDTPSDSEVKDA